MWLYHAPKKRIALPSFEAGVFPSSGRGGGRRRKKYNTIQHSTYTHYVLSYVMFSSFLVGTARRVPHLLDKRTTRLQAEGGKPCLSCTVTASFADEDGLFASFQLFLG